MMRAIVSLMLLAAVVLLSGCASSPAPPKPDPDLAKAGKLSPKMMNRANIFRSSIADKVECGFIVSSPSYRSYVDNYGALAARLAALGTKVAYLDSTSEVGLESGAAATELRKLLRIMHSRNLKCFLIVRDYQLVQHSGAGNATGPESHGFQRRRR